jgi:hypothetical protein
MPRVLRTRQPTRPRWVRRENRYRQGPVSRLHVELGKRTFGPQSAGAEPEVAHGFEPAHIRGVGPQDHALEQLVARLSLERGVSSVSCAVQGEGLE